MSTSVFGIVTSEVHLRDVITRLDQAGFRREDRSVVLPDKNTPHPLGHENSTKAPEGAVTGGLTGAGVGGIVGLLAGLGALAIPGVGPLIAAGPLLALLSGAAVGAAAGSLTGSLIGMGIPEYEAKRYEGHLKEGNILIAVHADNAEWAAKARKLLSDAEVMDISTSTDTAAERVDTTKSRIGNDTTIMSGRDSRNPGREGRSAEASGSGTDYSLHS